MRNTRNVTVAIPLRPLPPLSTPPLEKTEFKRFFSIPVRRIQSIYCQ